MKAIKAFIKHFEVPQRSIKNKNLTYFFISIQPSEMQGTWSIDEVMAKWDNKYGEDINSINSKA